MYVQFRETVCQVLNGILRGRVALRKILDDAVKLLVCSVGCICAVFNDMIHVARDIAEF